MKVTFCFQAGSDLESVRVFLEDPLLSVSTGGRLFYVHLQRRRRRSPDLFPGAPNHCNFEGPVIEPGTRALGRAVVTACPGSEIHALLITASGEVVSVAPAENGDKNGKRTVLKALHRRRPSSYI